MNSDEETTGLSSEDKVATAPDDAEAIGLAASPAWADKQQ
jgi:hypothetical protein